MIHTAQRLNSQATPSAPSVTRRQRVRISRRCAPRSTTRQFTIFIQWAQSVRPAFPVTWWPHATWVSTTGAITVCESRDRTWHKPSMFPTPAPGATKIEINSGPAVSLRVTSVASAQHTTARRFAQPATLQPPPMPILPPLPEIPRLPLWSAPRHLPIWGGIRAAIHSMRCVQVSRKMDCCAWVLSRERRHFRRKLAGGSSRPYSTTSCGQSLTRRC